MKKRGAFFYILIVAALLALAGLVFLLAPGAVPDTPAVVLPSATPAGSVGVTPPGSVDPDDLIAVDTATVQTAIATLSRVDSYSRTLLVRDFWTGGSRSRSIEVWAHGDSLRLCVRTSGSEVQENLLLKGQNKWLWYSDADGVYHGSTLAGDADAYQTLMTYENVLSAPAEDLLEAGYTEFGGVSCIYVRYRSGTLGYESECYVDPATGLLMGERCYDGAQLIYSMDSSIPDVSTPDDSVFLPPRTR